MGSGSEAVLFDIDGDPMAITNGTAIPAATSVLIGGGSDGTNARFIRVNSDGYQIIIGTGTAGSPTGGLITIQGDPAGTAVPISGTVTANAGSGNFSVVQATAANLNATVIGTVTANIGTTGGLALDSTLAKLTITPGTAIGSNTLAMVGGHVTTVSPTYTNGNINTLSLTTAGALRIDGSGVVHPVSQSGTWTVQQGTPPWSVVGAAADGAAITGNPVLIGGTDGTNVQTVELRNSHPVGDVQGIIVRSIKTTYPTFYAVFDRISPAANKYMATLFNTSSIRKVVIQRIWVYNWQFATVAGALLEQYITKITARTIGTSTTIYAEDTNDSLSSGISADTNSSAVTEDHILRRFLAYSEEAVTNLGQLSGSRAAGDDNTALILEKKDDTRGIVLRQNQGISIRNITNSTVGTVSYVFEFTDEVA